MSPTRQPAPAVTTTSSPPEVPCNAGTTAAGADHASDCPACAGTARARHLQPCPASHAGVHCDRRAGHDGKHWHDPDDGETVEWADEEGPLPSERDMDGIPLPWGMR